jgi:hypothetical protein
MKRLSFALLLIALPALFSCASTSKAPAELDAAAKSYSAPADKGVVYLYRLGRAVGAATTTQIRVNSVDAGGTGPGTFFTWELKPGRYTFSANTTESSQTIQLEVEAGKVYFIEQIERIGLAGGRIQLEQRDEATGKKNVSKLKMIVSSYVPEE